MLIKYVVDYRARNENHRKGELHERPDSEARRLVNLCIARPASRADVEAEMERNKTTAEGGCATSEIAEMKQMNAAPRDKMMRAAKTKDGKSVASGAKRRRSRKRKRSD